MIMNSCCLYICYIDNCLYKKKSKHQFAVSNKSVDSLVQRRLHVYGLVVRQNVYKKCFVKQHHTNTPSDIMATTLTPCLSYND